MSAIVEVDELDSELWSGGDVVFFFDVAMLPQLLLSVTHCRSIKCISGRGSPKFKRSLNGSGRRFEF